MMPPTLLLTRVDVARCLSLGDCILAVEQAFRAQAEGRALGPGALGVHAGDGGFHVKAAGLPHSRSYFAAKINANFPRNPERLGLPMIQGIIYLCDAENGFPLAVMDSIEITILRTGAASAVAAKYLAREDAPVMTICGCGNQGRVQLRALAQVRKLERAFAFDIDAEKAETFARQLSAELHIEVRTVREVATAAPQSDICVTCTPSRQAFLMREHIAPGTFVAAVGADSPEKHELDPGLLAGSKVVVDILEQCASIGELHHALQGGWMRCDEVHAELGEIVAGRKPGRESAEEIIIFDSTGTALQDVAAAAIAYENALAAGLGRRIEFAPAPDAHQTRSAEYGLGNL